MSDFITAGAVPIDAEAYVHRGFEDEAFGYLTSKAADWVLLLGPRQHGKTSGLLRLQARLIDNGFDVALVDLQAYGGRGDYSEFLRWLAGCVAKAVGNRAPTTVDDREDSLEGWLSAALEGITGSVAVFIDEAAAIPEDCRRRLYPQLRALFNARRQPGKPRAIAQLVFVFAGTFRPELLIDTDNSPFNVSQDVAPTDLTRNEAKLLARIAGNLPDDVVDEIYDLVGGQPYLLQTLFRAARGEPEGLQGRLDAAVLRLRNGNDRHAVALFDRVCADADSAAVVVAMVDGGGSCTSNAADPIHAWLEVLGIARARDGRLTFRNRLYQEFAFDAPQLRRP